MTGYNLSSEDSSKNLFGCAQRLVPVLEPYGFAFEVEGAGISSGGEFASGFFVHPGLRIGLIIRGGSRLGCVVYEFAESNAAHEKVLAELGVDAPALRYDEDRFLSYSCAGGDPIEALVHDLTGALLPAFESSPVRVQEAIRSAHRRWLETIGFRR